MSIANELITRGWHQGGFTDDETGAVCLEGAAWCAATGMAFRDLGSRWTTDEEHAAAQRAIDALRAALPINAPPNKNPIAWFNDNPARTFDEVLRVAKEVDEILDFA